MQEASKESISLTEEQSQISSQEFQQQGYCLLTSPLSSQLLGLMQTYTSFYTKFHPSYFVKVNNSLVRYGDLLFESTLLNIQGMAEQVAGLRLSPVFSVVQILPDQINLNEKFVISTSGVSALLNIGESLECTLEQGGKSKRLTLDIGEILFYAAKAIEFNALTSPARKNTLALFHYVDAQGEFSDWEFDKRSGIGTLMSRSEMEARIIELKG